MWPRAVASSSIPLALASGPGLGRDPGAEDAWRRSSGDTASSGRSGGDFVFDHHQVQEALYGGLSELLREEYHAAIAEALEARAGAADKDPKDLDGALCVDLCEHFLKGAQGEKALRYLDAALDHLEQGYLNDQAIALADRALAVPGLLRGEERLDVLLRKNERLDLLGRRRRRRPCWPRPAPWPRRRDDQACLREGGAGDGHPAVDARAATRRRREHFERSLAIAREIGDREGEAAATGNLGNVFSVPRPLRGGAGAPRAAARDRPRDRGPAGRGQRPRGTWARVLLPRPLRGGAGALRAVSRDRPRDRGPAGRGRPPRGTWATSSAPSAATRRRGSTTSGTSRSPARSGTGRARPRPRGTWATCFYALGRYEEAREHYERHLRDRPRDRGPAGRGHRHGEPGHRAASRLGRYEEAREHYERPLAIAREIGDRRGEAMALREPGRPVARARGGRAGTRGAGSVAGSSAARSAHAPSEG